MFKYNFKDFKKLDYIQVYIFELEVINRSQFTVHNRQNKNSFYLVVYFVFYN